MQQQAITLLELNQTIGQALRNNLEPMYWIVAEISELKVNYRGHCYLELVDKQEGQQDIVARCRATIWNQFFRLIQPYFETTTKQPLTEGIKIMVKVSVDFHELYGLSLNIKDIDPTYTLGDLAKQKQEIIDQLTHEGVLEMNKQLVFPTLPKRIAVVSSEKAAGYEDFMNQLYNNNQGYAIHTELFQAVMQGRETEKTIVAMLEQIYERHHEFDAVAIIRGGGAQADLNSFNTYWLAYHVTQFPLPVITGIGHEKDDTIIDMVAHTRLKTPTAVANFLIDCFAEAEDYLHTLSQIMQQHIYSVIDTNNNQLKHLTNKCLHLTRKHLEKNQVLLTGYKEKIRHLPTQFIKAGLQHLVYAHKRTRQLVKTISNIHIRKLEGYSKGFSNVSKSYVLRKENQLENAALRVHYLNPNRVLERGYSITYADNKLLRNSQGVKNGQELLTIVEKGKIKSTVK